MSETAARIHLEQPGARHRVEFLERVANSRELHGRWAYPPDTPAAYEAYLARVAQPEYEGYLVCDDDGAVTGCINVNNIVRGALQSGYLGYAAFVPFAGGGYLTEGLRAVLVEVFDRLRLHRVEANIQPGNARSQALARRCGFRLEGFSPRYLQLGGEWRDHERWAITVEDWRKER